MSNSVCKSSVLKTYQEVIADVINNVRDHFIEDGVDEMALQELKSLWETKLMATKAVEENKDPEKFVDAKASKQQQQLQQHYNIPQNQQSQINKQVCVPPNNHVPQGIPFPEWRRVPIQLTIPSAPGSTEKRVLGIEVPEVFLQGHYLKSILTGAIIGETMNRPLAEASQYLQDQVNSAFYKYQQSTNLNVNINMGVNPLQIEQFDGCSHDDEEPTIRIELGLNRANRVAVKNVYQNDGTVDSSEEDEDDDDDDNDDGEQDDEPDEDPEESQEVAEEEPLNSGDDVSDADGTEESFETDNVVVCQYDKITRARNRWKFHLKDGIMNLNGEDYVFQKANGDAEW